ncbi:uncharacterized protein [Neodiprion pinetum]|uniref:Uncharacterized protein LOC107223803 n=1 Tax=Neodiprion lecontei TaxID=441921 RepID=A0A6J0BXU8_NEOLC|nr:uncharacterized protein LOC107223803 [Neodiprion lecontei]XP_015519098.1 uncharacterized protein LOC107223803 [Neodiprion lecontei]XP_046409875.1 uncharacterized protein LOC124174621 [Neodiprion fabricii]XP_046409876.1 uncharacterized protein LOC124174621 [Neodiprion fabricii]XP_046466812.1 uncharacterized protein LOC124211604 [Neodiprion pinetum]XP_046466813.1 uncharacterized protein LOC124211604 [Neodiprion pinetum]XP_046604677.1 uncharacterized protein LOC124297557 [Neodiprion virginian
MDVFVDEETGESLESVALRGAGQSLTLNFTDPENNNLETGEPEEDPGNGRIVRRRVPFQIPRALQRQDSGEEEEEERTADHIHQDNHECSRVVKRVLRRSEPFGQTNPTMLLIPLVFYFRWVIAILMCLEVFLHVWAHHKNKHLKNADVYFRSPFHSITSEFCALCQSETCMDRVGKMQEIRAGKFLRQCNYMKRVVT